MKKKRGKKNKWTVAIIGVFLLALFLSLLGFFTEQNKSLVEWKFYLALFGCLVSVGIIIFGIFLAKKKK